MTVKEYLKNKNIKNNIVFLYFKEENAEEFSTEQYKYKKDIPNSILKKELMIIEKEEEEGNLLLWIK